MPTVEVEEPKCKNIFLLGAGQMDVNEFANRLGIQNCLEFDPQLLVVEDRVRSLCQVNRCGNYGKSYMCPPLVPSLNDIKSRLQTFHSGVLLQYWINLDVKHDVEGIRNSMLDFQNKSLQVEEYLEGRGNKQVWGITAGTCAQCKICGVESKTPCLHPEKARASMEALGIDVIGLLTRLGLDSQFHTDKVTWTGCILF
jgi:predicted metal-binding protein